MLKIICSTCGRVEAGTENEPHETATHTYCARCQFGFEEFMRVPMKDMLNPALKSDPLVMDAIQFIKEEIRREISENVRWLGEEKKYPEEVSRLYDSLVKEVNNEIASEAKGEITKM